MAYSIKQIYLSLLLSCFSLSVLAEGLTIEITEGTESTIPIAIVPFARKSAPLSTNMASIISKDLQLSGYFNPLSQAKMPAKPSDAKDIKLRQWQDLNQEYLLIGRIKKNAQKYDVEFQLFNVYKGTQIVGYKLTIAKNEFRKTAHRISDIIYQKLTGHKGAFNSRIAYVTTHVKPKQRKRYKLQIADADGLDPHTIASSLEPLMSPAWSADGKKIAYVSFENRKPAIYIQVLATGQRRKVSDFSGINGAPSWSPDGHYLALTLSKDGNPDIYTLKLSNLALKKLTHNTAIDTEPSWSPDGKQLVFTSNRGGKPQIYKISSRGGTAKRLTFKGNYNAKASFSPDGQSLAIVHAQQGHYRIAVLHLKSGSLSVLTRGSLDESPSFSPNGTTILYASKIGKKSVLQAISIDGQLHHQLVNQGGEVREPTWSP